MSLIGWCSGSGRHAGIPGLHWMWGMLVGDAAIAMQFREVCA